GAGGQRILKQVGDPALGTGHREHYIRDAQGNIMAVYKYTNNGGASTQLVKRPVYGSRRLGSYAKPQEVMGSGLISNQHTAPLLAADQRYELTDHLGNVNTVVTGRLLPGNGAGSAKQAEVVSAQGYEAFGMLLTGRNFNSGATRHGFNGKENDNEWHGAVGTLQDYGMRAYDTRVARFFAVDPIAKEYPMLTPYQFAGNTPIWAVDLDGLEPAYVNNGIPVMGSDHLYNGNPEYKPVIKLSQPSEAQRYLPYSPSSIDLHMGINSMATKEIGGVTTKFSTHNENFSGRQTGVVENTSKRNVTVSEPETFGFDLIVFSVDERIQKASIVDKGDFNGIPIKQYSGYTETITDISVGPLQMRSRSVEHRDARGNTQTVESSTQIGLDFQKGFRLGGKDNPGIEIGGGVEIRTP
ncbi:MAG: RHS repeat-associated core domain-containing protein, partial [Flavobacteriales bacterium]|nr:RHS repeat-associated core domain-containing protein [Flavobacteriales bacterium]